MCPTFLHHLQPFLCDGFKTVGPIYLQSVAFEFLGKLIPEASRLP